MGCFSGGSKEMKRMAQVHPAPLFYDSNIGCLPQNAIYRFPQIDVPESTTLANKGLDARIS